MSSNTKIKFAFDIPNLIKAVEKRPGLYDSSSPEYRDRCTKKKLWDEVCIDVCTVDEWNRLTKTAKGELGFELQRKWHNLRSCYRRELGVLYKKHTGQLGKKMKRTYYYFKALDFLRPYCIADARYPLNRIPTEVETDHSVDLETEYLEDPLDNDDESDQDNRSTSPSSSQNYEQSMDLQDIKAEDAFLSNKQKNDYSMTRDQHGYSKNGKGINKIYSEVEFRVRSDDDIENNTKKRKRKEDKASDDGDEEFLKSLLPSLREFTPDQKLLLRIEIMKTILNFKKSLK